MNNIITNIRVFRFLKGINYQNLNLNGHVFKLDVFQSTAFLALLFHSQFPFSSFSSSNSQSSALLHFNHSLSLHFILHFLVFVYLITHLDKNIYEAVSHHIISFLIILYMIKVGLIRHGCAA